MQTCALHFGRQIWEVPRSQGRFSPFGVYFLSINTTHCRQFVFEDDFSVSPVLVLNVTTKTDTIWSFSSHFTILSSTNASGDPKSERGSTSLSLPSWVQGIAGVVLQASDLLVVGPPGPLLHPNPGAAHPDEPRLLGGLDSRSFPCAVGGAAVSSGFSGGTSSQSSRGARSDRSIILSAVPPQQCRRGLEMMSQPRGSASIRRQ